MTSELPLLALAPRRRVAAHRPPPTTSTDQPKRCTATSSVTIVCLVRLRHRMKGCMMAATKSPTPNQCCSRPANDDDPDVANGQDDERTQSWWQCDSEASVVRQLDFPLASMPSDWIHRSRSLLRPAANILRHNQPAFRNESMKVKEQKEGCK